MTEYIVEGEKWQLNFLLKSYFDFAEIQNGNLELITTEIIQPENDIDLEMFSFDLLRLKIEYLSGLDKTEPIQFEIIDKNTIICNEEQLRILSWACDLISRIKLCQFDHIADIVTPIDDPKFRKLHQFRKDLDSLKSYWGLSSSSYFGIFSSKVSDSARTLWDMHQVIRNRLAYDANPGVTPQNRWEMKKFTVDFDEPFHANEKVPLIKIKKKD